MSKNQTKPIKLTAGEKRRGLTRSAKVRGWMARNGFRCRHCRQRYAQREDVAHGVNHLTIGHVIPRVLGGPSALWNVVPLCWDCNQEQGDAFWPHLWGSTPPPEYALWRAKQRAMEMAA